MKDRIDLNVIGHINIPVINNFTVSIKKGINPSWINALVSAYREFYFSFKYLMDFRISKMKLRMKSKNGIPSMIKITNNAPVLPPVCVAIAPANIAITPVKIFTTIITIRKNNSR